MAKAPHDFLKDITIETRSGPRLTKVMLLSETEQAYVFIPLNSITQVDYDRLKAVYDNTELDMLTTLRDHRMDNGRNALVTYRQLIKVKNKKSLGVETAETIRASQGQEDAQESQESQETGQEDQTEQAPKPARRKPGPKPKAKS